MRAKDNLDKALDLSDEVLKLTKSEREKILKEHFELHISDEALTALKSKSYR